ncbi:MAG: chorismate mutase [Rhodospirillales bacterium]|nr:chorismate mutase [Rhodospirillales bacterium]
MTTDKDNLQSLRQEIDAIDDSIHDLIMERTRVVERVRKVKRADKIKIRPAREAEILYRLLARHKGPFPKQELAGIWRDMIVATLRFEGPFSVAVATGDDETGYWDLARDQYGSFTPMRRHVSTRGVVEAVRNLDATVGVLPMPRPDDTEFWWRLMVSEAPETPRVIARLPFIPGDNSNRLKGLDALVICGVPQEETGRDHSYLSIEAEEDIGFGAIESAMSQSGLPIVFQQLIHDPDRPAAWVYLIEVAQFVDGEGRQMRRLLDGLGGRAKRVLHLGGYATPLDTTEVKNAMPGEPTPGNPS